MNTPTGLGLGAAGLALLVGTYSAGKAIERARIEHEMECISGARSQEEWNEAEAMARVKGYWTESAFKNRVYEKDVRDILQNKRYVNCGSATKYILAQVSTAVKDHFAEEFGIK